MQIKFRKIFTWSTQHLAFYVFVKQKRRNIVLVFMFIRRQLFCWHILTLHTHNKINLYGIFSLIKQLHKKEIQPKAKINNMVQNNNMHIQLVLGGGSNVNWIWCCWKTILREIKQ